PVSSNDTFPFPTVGWPRDRHQADSVFGGITARLAGHDNMITGLHRRPRDVLTRQLSASAPFERPDLGRALLVWSLHLDKRMGIPPQELLNCAFNFHHFVGI